jgi:pyruvate/2-oxoglutarate dehydrogenase complex dihydrolipoamide acyltransferase (E2) component
VTRRPEPTGEAVRLAANLGVDLSRVCGTGPAGEVTAGDVKRVADYRKDTARHLAAVPGEPRSLTVGGRPAADPAVVGANTRVAVASPDVRQLANTRGVLLSRVRGTGPNGAVTKSDVLDSAAAQDRQRAVAHRRAFPTPQAAPEPRVSFTASGLPVSVLDEVPPSVRRALAAAPDHAAAFPLVERYGPLADEDAARLLRSDRTVSTRYGGARRDTPVPGWD